MQETVERLKQNCRSHLDLTFGLCRTGLGCCGKVAELNTATAQKMLAQVAADFESLARGDAAGFATASGKLAVAHWTSALSCGLEFQRQLVASFAPK